MKRSLTPEYPNSIVCLHDEETSESKGAGHGSTGAQPQSDYVAAQWWSGFIRASCSRRRTMGFSSGYSSHLSRHAPSTTLITTASYQVSLERSQASTRLPTLISSQSRGLDGTGSGDTSTSTKSDLGDLTGRDLGEEAGFLGLVSDMRKAPETQTGARRLPVAGR